MIVVSNTSPLNYLIQLGYSHILAAQFGALLVPPAVVRELAQPHSRAAVRAGINAPPSWLTIQNPDLPIPADLARLGDGEASAIQLAVELKADFVIVDERAGRSAAELRQVSVVGTLAVLERASVMDSTFDLHNAVRDLQSLGFRVSPALLRLILPGYR